MVVMCLLVFGYCVDFDELIVFFCEVVEVLSLLVMVYNNFEVFGVDFLLVMIVCLFEEIENIVAIKECLGDACWILELIWFVLEFEVVVGGDNWVFEGLVVGVVGWIIGVGVVVLCEMVEFYDLI